MRGRRGLTIPQTKKTTTNRGGSGHHQTRWCAAQRLCRVHGKESKAEFFDGNPVRLELCLQGLYCNGRGRRGEEQQGRREWTGVQAKV